MNGLFSVPNPAPTKYLLNQQGISVGPVRLPLVDLNAEQGTKLQAILEGLSK